MESNQKHEISTLRQKHIDTSISNIMMLKVMISTDGEILPEELISYIMGIIWNIRSQPYLETFLNYNIPSPRQSPSTLLLGDIIDSLSDLGKVNLLLSNHNEYYFFLKFQNPITFSQHSKGVLVSTRVNLGIISEYPFSIKFVNRKCAIGSHSMYFYLCTDMVMDINKDLYTSIVESRPELAKYYVKRGKNYIWYDFDTETYKEEYEITKDAKRQIMIIWLRKFSKQVIENGFCLTKEHQKMSKSITIDDILSDCDTLRVIY